MDDIRCPFGDGIRSGELACPRAREVARRDGPGVACDDPAAQSACAALLEGMRAAGLAAFGADDDPARTPASVLLKVQVGGMRGLQGLLASGAGPVTDVGGLVSQAALRYGGVRGVPFAELAPEMLGCKLRRRGR